MIDLTYIIPVYNIEKYLAKCLDSVLVDNQFTGQVVCVNDGSTDGSGKILEAYARKYPNVEVITQPNAGLSAARNAGIKAAKGEYVCFLDSDDYWSPNMLGGLMRQVERDQLDVLRFDYQNVRLQTENDRMSRDKSLNEPLTLNDMRYEVFQPYKQPHNVDKRGDVVDGVTYLNERMGYECYATQFLIRHNLIIDDRCLFTEGIHFEDVEWLPRMMLKARRVGSTETVVYNYFWREGSITLTQGNKDKIRKNLDDRMSIVEKYSELHKQHPECTWLKNMQSSMAAGVLTTVAREFYKERKEYIYRLREMNAFPMAITNQGKTYARRARIINALGANTFCLIMRLASVSSKV